MKINKNKIKTFSIHSPKKNWDAIVIGSGMGGMCTAALLAKLGKKVLILEQHYVPGGFTHCFRRKKWVWDVGVHAVGEVTSHSMIGRLLGKLTNHKLNWVSLGSVYENFHFPDQFKIDFPDSPEQFRNNLIKAFPHDIPAIDSYFEKVNTVSKAMRNYYLAKALPKKWSQLTQHYLSGEAQKYFMQNTSEVLDNLTHNQKLKTILASQWGYYGSPPSRSSFAIQALVAKHFKHGGYYPEGGSGKIAETLLETVLQAGGWTRIKADVQEIIIERKKAVGVRLGNGEVIRAKKIISAIGAIETVSRLLPQTETEKPWVKSIQDLQPSSAHLCLNLGFKGDIRQAGASSANQWFWDSWDSEIEAWDFTDPEALAPLLYTSFPSLKDPLHHAGEEQLHTGEVVTFVPYSIFEKWQNQRVMNRESDYQALKTDLTQRLKNQLLKHMPDLKHMIAYAELSTPLSTQFFTRPVKGAIYGIEPTPARFKNPWLRPDTPVKNLYLSGSDIATVGVMGAMVGGILAAVACEPLKGLNYLRNIE